MKISKIFSITFLLLAITSSSIRSATVANSRCGNNCIQCMPHEQTSDFCLLCLNRQLVLTTSAATTAHCSTSNLPTSMHCSTYGYRFDGSLGCVECQANFYLDYSTGICEVHPVSQIQNCFRG